jgi:hypothetical protein
VTYHIPLHVGSAGSNGWTRRRPFHPQIPGNRSFSDHCSIVWPTGPVGCDVVCRRIRCVGPCIERSPQGEECSLEGMHLLIHVMSAIKPSMNAWESCVQSMLDRKALHALFPWRIRIPILSDLQDIPVIRPSHSTQLPQSCELPPSNLPSPPDISILPPIRVCSAPIRPS